MNKYEKLKSVRKTFPWAEKKLHLKTETQIVLHLTTPKIIHRTLSLVDSSHTERARREYNQNKYLVEEIYKNIENESITQDIYKSFQLATNSE